MSQNVPVKQIQVDERRRKVSELYLKNMSITKPSFKNLVKYNKSVCFSTELWLKSFEMDEFATSFYENDLNTIETITQLNENHLAGMGILSIGNFNF